MRPPVCAVCGREGRGPSDVFSFELIEFADFERQPGAEQGSESLPSRPRGLEWFCPDCAGRARCLRRLTSTEAVQQLTEEQRLG